MSQFEVSAKSVRDQIRRLLHDSYRGGFPILKELVQNADDAGARNLLVINQPDGVMNTGHPLLDGPALLAINDAKFTPRDEAGIKSLGDSGKAGDGRKIGRFGLGMKAVFHLCDAFAWLASIQTVQEDIRFTDETLINPWGGLSSHADWPDPTHAQWARARDVAQRRAVEFGASSDWFCLWIPLRTNALIGDGRGTFGPVYEQALSELLSPVGGRQIAAALPVLRSLRTVRVGSGRDGYVLKVETGSVERPSGTRRIEDQVGMSTGAGEQLFRAAGAATERPDLAAEFQGRPGWPKQEDAAGRIIDAPARAAGAAYFIADTRAEIAGPWCLGVLPAVYLPLPEKAEALADANVLLVLHGEFFIDAGRRGLVLDGATAQTAVETSWNGTLLERVILPAVPHALMALADQVDPARRDGLVAAVIDHLWIAPCLSGNGRFAERWLRATGRRQQIHFRLGRVHGWQIAESKVPAYVLDCVCVGPPDSAAALALTERMRAALPGFDSVSGDLILVPKKSRSLSARPPASMPVDVARRLLGKPKELASVFDRESAALIAPVLELIERDTNGDGGLVYVRELIAAWSGRTRARRDADAEALKQIVALISVDLLVVVPEHLPEAVLLHPVRGLLVPAPLADPTKANGHLPADEVRSLLELAVAGKLSPTVLSRFAGDLFGVLEGDADVLDDLAVFRSRLGDGDRLFSLLELKTASTEGRLFAGGESVGAALASATGLGVIVCPDVPAARLPLAPAYCDAAAACATLNQHRVVVAKPNDRLALLTQLLKSEITVVARSALRLLLAGRPTTVDEHLIVSDDQANVWADLLRVANEYTAASAAIVDGLLVQSLNLTQRAALGVVPLSATSVLDRIGLLDDAAVAGLKLSADLDAALYDRVLDEIARSPGEHRRVGRLLPIHPATGGGRVSCDENSFVLAGTDTYELPAAIRDQLRLLRPHSNEYRRRAQQYLVSDLDAVVLLGRLVGHEEAAQRVTVGPNLFIDLLGDCRSRLPDELKDRLARLAWLPTPTGLRAPADVLRLPFSALRWTSGAEVSETDLADDLRKQLSKFGLLLPNWETSMRRFAESLAHDDKFRVGVRVANERDDDRIVYDDWQRLFGAADSLMPITAVLREVAEGKWPAGLDWPTVRASLLWPLAKPINNTDRWVEILNHLGRRHELETSLERRHATEAVLKTYLRTAVTHQEWQTILPRLCLPSEAGTSEPASSLCSGTPGVADKHLLSDAFSALLRDHVHGPREGQGPAQSVAAPYTFDPRKTATTLRSYVEALPAAPAVIGALLMLLGNDDDLRELAAQYLGARTIEGTRARVLPWEVDPTSNARGRQMTLEQTCANTFVTVMVTPARPIRTTNLCGQPAEFTPSERPRSLLMGEPERFPLPKSINGVRNAHRVVLRDLRGLSLSPADATALLRTTAVEVLKHVHWRWNIDLQDLWAELSEAEQIDVRAAADTIIEQIDAHLRRLSVDRLPLFRPALSTIDQARDRRAEAKLAENPKQTSETERELKAATDAVADLLLGDAAAQAQVIDALRAKVAESGYEPASVPLELFQNADDAAVEQAQMHALSGLDSVRPVADVFVVSELPDGSLRFAHWGRPINKFVYGRFNGRDRGFGRDLRKMVSLSESDKLVDSIAMTDGARATTGRFGLGFKSVFLVSERPRAVSGWLSFEVRGGLLPTLLRDDEPQRLREAAARLWTAVTGQADAPAGATLLELPPRNVGNGAAATDVLRHFVRSAPLLVIFAKRLRRVLIESGGSLKAAWEPSALEGVRGVEIGPLMAAHFWPAAKIGDNAARPPTRALFFGGPEREGILIGLDRDGPAPLFGLPDVWVTTPGRRAVGSGVVVNGPFNVDPGRTQLRAAADQTDVVAGRIAAQFGTQLIELFDATTREWPMVRKTLGLSDELSVNAFWSRLFDILTPTLNEDGPEVAVIRTALSGIGRLLTDRPAVPTGVLLEAPMLRISDLRVVLTGTLANLPLARERVSTWACWPRLTSGRCVVASVRDRLRRLGITMPEVRTVSLAHAVAAELEDGAGPEAAARVGRVVGPILEPPGVSAAISIAVSDTERSALIDALRGKRFKADNGVWRDAADLLLPANAVDAEDEQLRGVFATPGHRLNDKYDADGIELFRVVRGLSVTRTGAEAMADWAFAAQTQAARAGVLHYLAIGSAANALAKVMLADERFNTTSWLSGLTIDDPQLRDSLPNEHQRLTVLSRLELLAGRIQSITWPIEIEPLSAAPLPKPRDFLHDLRDRWTTESKKLTADYERRLYGGRPTAFDVDRLHEADHRETCFELFMLGALHTTPFGNQASWGSFVARCRTDGWLATFALHEPDPGEWMAVLDRYVREELREPQFRLEMQRFPEIYQLGLHLNDYIEALVEAAKLGSVTETDLYDPRRSAHLSGTGIGDAPSLRRATGIGRHFITRELVRRRLLDAPAFAPFCYVPVRRVRLLINGWGGEGATSRGIYNFLVEHLGPIDALFDNSFDLPLLAAVDGQLEGLGAVAAEYLSQRERDEIQREGLDSQKDWR